MIVANFFDDCVKEWMNRSTSCPQCRGNIKEAKPVSKFVKQMMMSLRLRCSKDGCNKIVEWYDLDGHLRKCDYTHVTCGVTVQQKGLEAT